MSALAARVVVLSRACNPPPPPPPPRFRFVLREMEFRVALKRRPAAGANDNDEREMRSGRVGFFEHFIFRQLGSGTPRYDLVSKRLKQIYTASTNSLTHNIWHTI